MFDASSLPLLVLFSFRQRERDAEASVHLSIYAGAIVHLPFTLVYPPNEFKHASFAFFMDLKIFEIEQSKIKENSSNNVNE